MSSLTIRLVAERYGVSIHTVLAWVRADELKAINVSRSARAKRPSWRVTQAALDAFEARRTPSPEAATTARAPRKRKGPADMVEFY